MEDQKQGQTNFLYLKVYTPKQFFFDKFTHYQAVINEEILSNFGTSANLSKHPNTYSWLCKSHVGLTRNSLPFFNMFSQGINIHL